MRIKKLIEQLKAMPEKMEGFNSEGELVVLNTAQLRRMFRQCAIPSGTAHRPCGCGHRSFSNSKTKEKTRCKTKTR